jgi:hypothetical protein
MAAKKKQQTHAKRARELAVKERRERKRARKAERAASNPEAVDGGSVEPGTEAQPESAAAEWVR